MHKQSFIEMTRLKLIEKWGNHHHPAFLDIIRVVLGLFLLIKGFTFLQNNAYLEYMLASLNLSFLTTGMIKAIMFYVIFTHMAGGSLIMLGIFTRLACLLQIPVICAAIAVINNLRSVLNSDWWLSVSCLFFLLVFIVLGSGPFSLDNYLAKDKMN